MSLTSAGQSTTSSTPKSTSQSKILIRPGRISDCFAIGRIAAYTYQDTDLTHYLSPRAREHYNAYKRGFTERALQRLLSPRNQTFAAYEESNPEVVIGYAQFVRLGDDEGARKQIESRKRSWMAPALWLWTLILPVLYWVDRGTCDDVEHVREFLSVGDEETEEHFERWTKRRCRWHAQSVVVLPEFQGRGVGKRLMGKVIEMAEEEGVPVGIEASAEGEPMYRRVGFELVSRFRPLKGMRGDGSKGGIFMWRPSGWVEGEDVVGEEKKLK